MSEESVEAQAEVSEAPSQAIEAPSMDALQSAMATMKAWESSQNITSNEPVQEVQEVQEQSTSEVEKPDWLMDKYLLGGRSVEDAIQVQAKSAMELNKKLSSRADQPEYFGIEEEYTPTVLKDSSHQIAADHPLYESTVGVMKELGLNQKGHDLLVGKFIEYEKQQIEQATIQIEQSLNSLDRGEERVNNIETWLSDRYGEDGKILSSLIRLDGKAVPVVEKILKGVSNAPMPDNAKQYIVNNESRMEKWNAMMDEKDQSGQYKLDTNQEFRKEWERLGKLVHKG